MFVRGHWPTSGADIVRFRARDDLSFDAPRLRALMDQGPTWFSENDGLLLTQGGRARSAGLGSGYELINLRKAQIMSCRTLISLAASAIVGIVFLVSISTDASAYRRGGMARAGVYHGGVARGGVYRGGVARAGVYRGGVYRGGVYRGAPVARGVAVGVGAAAVGAAAAGAYYAPRCGYYPYPPCY
jgi:hypothetical protein